VRKKTVTALAGWTAWHCGKCAYIYEQWRSTSSHSTLVWHLLAQNRSSWFVENAVN